MSGLTVLQGKLNEDIEDETISKMVRSFKDQKNRFGKNRKTAHLLTSVSRYLNSRKADMKGIKFYNYFESCPYWSKNVPQQKKFRESLIEALIDASNQIYR